MNDETAIAVFNSVQDLFDWSQTFVLAGIHIQVGDSFPATGKSTFMNDIGARIKNAMYALGVELTSQGGKSFRQENGNEVIYKYLTCSYRKRKYDQSRLKGLRKTYSKKICMCNAQLAFRLEDNQWVVTSITEQHEGHFRRHLLKGQLTTDQKEELRSTVAEDLSPMHSVINGHARKYGQMLTSQQVRNATRPDAEEAVHQSQFSQLIQYLNEHDSMAYYAKYNIERLCNGKWKFIRTKTQAKIPGIQSTAAHASMFSSFGVLDILLNPDLLLPPKSDACRLNFDSHERLVPVGISWVDKECMFNAAKFGEVIQLDSTSKTNCQKRPLIFVSTVDSNLKTLCLFTSLTANESEESYLFVLRSILFLYGSSFCKNIDFVLSDGDNVICSCIDRFITSRVFSSKCQRALCYWHTVNVAILKNVHRSANESVDRVKEVVLILINHICKCAESEEEFDCMWKQMAKWLETLVAIRSGSIRLTEITHAELSKVLEIIYSKRYYLALAYRMKSLSFNERTTGRSEAENRVIKTMGVNNRVSLSRVAQAAILRESIRLNNNKNIYERQACADPYILRILDEKLDPETKLTLRLVSNKALQILCEQYSQAGLYSITQIRPELFEVSRIPESTQSHCFKITLADGTEVVSPIEHKVKVRKISLNTYSKEVICSCAHFQRFLLPCRHIIRLKNYTIHLQDVGMRWLSAYQTDRIPLQLEREYCNPRIDTLEDVDFSHSEVNVDEEVEEACQNEQDGPEESAENDQNVLEQLSTKPQSSKERFHTAKQSADCTYQKLIATLQQNHSTTEGLARFLALCKKIDNCIDVDNEEFMRPRMPSSSNTGPIVDSPFLPSRGIPTNARSQAFYERKRAKKRPRASEMFEQENFADIANVASPTAQRGRGRPAKN